MGTLLQRLFMEKSNKKSGKGGKEKERKKRIKNGREKRWWW